MDRPAKENKTGAVAAAGTARAGKEAPPSGVAADLAALEAALIADIETFDQRTQVAERQAAGAQAAGTKKSGGGFPEILVDGTAQRQAATASRASPTAAGRPAGLPSAQPGGNGLLAQLREQAQARQNNDVVRQRELSATSVQLDAALRQIFSYCHDLVQQLNILRPPIERHYSLLGSLEFSGLQWQKGFVDYRTREQSAGAAYERVTLSCQLAAPEQLRIERDGLSADGFRKMLFDNGVVFTCEEIRNARQMVEKAVFAIAAEVKINLRWRADLDSGIVVLESRNLERFGVQRHVVPPQAVTAALLDDFGLLLLGRPNRFRDHLYKR